MRRIALLGAVTLCAILLSGVAWHSIEEIHYLKSFFPDEFTVAEAKDASVIEFVKVAIIAIPVALIVGACLALYKNT